MRPQLIISILMIFLPSINVTSQTYIWGGPGNANSEFANGLNDWTVNSISPNDSAIWLWEADGKADKGAWWYGRPPIESPSISNGAAVFDSDYYDNVGIENNSGNGIAPYPQTSELISPTFSCINQESVWIQFNQFYRNWQSTTKIAVSIDEGLTWSESIDVNEDITRNNTTQNNSLKLINISSIAKNQATVKIKFIWEGGYYFWIIDDVYIVSNPPGDPQIIGTWYPPNRFNTPLFNLENETMKFKMDVANKGGLDLVSLEGRVTILNTDKNTIHYSDTSYFDLNYNDTATVSFSSYMPDPNLLDTGLYVAIYEVISEDDFATSDNKTFNQYFRISDYGIYANDQPLRTNWKYSICDNNAEGSYSYQGNNNDGPIYNTYHINYYKTGHWLKSSNISVRAYYTNVGVWMNTDNPDATISYPVSFFIFEGADTLKDDLSNFNLIDGIIVDGNESSQFEYVGYAAENIENVEKFELVDVPLISADDEVDYVELEPNSKYFLAALWPKGERYYQIHDNQYNGIKRFYYEAQVMSFRYANYGDGARFWGISRDLGAWQMGLKSKFKILTKENSFPENTMQILQNPVTNNLKIHIDFEDIIKKGTIAIYSLNGDLITMRNINNYKTGTLEFGVNNLPAGVYFITLFTRDKLITKKFIVKR